MSGTTAWAAVPKSKPTVAPRKGDGESIPPDPPDAVVSAVEALVERMQVLA